MKKKIVVLLAFLILASVIFTNLNKGFATDDRANIYDIVLHDNGYQPSEITIEKGTLVRFSTTRDKPHWPASNLHPTHFIYSDFDPLRALDPEETWEFVFDKVGVWQFHDHIRSYYRGTITVTDPAK